MKTATSKAQATITMQELRKDPLGFLRQINDGVEVKVIYHSREFATVKSATATPKVGQPRGAQFYLDLAAKAQASRTGKPILDPNRSIKELYHEMLDNDSKYKAHGSR